MKVVDFSTPSKVRKFPILEPDIGDNEINNLLECANTGWISSQGKFIKEFEIGFSNYLSGGHAVAVSNGTAAIQLGMLALGIGVNDEVIVPNFTFGASINAIIHVGATPVLVDVDPETWTLSIEAIEKAINKKTILVTGGTGSFGKKLIKTVLDKNVRCPDSREVYFGRFRENIIGGRGYFLAANLGGKPVA